jgi:hypothetical protein
VNDASTFYCYLLVAIDHHERADLRERRICNNSLLASAAEFRQVAACGTFAFAPTRLCMHSPRSVAHIAEGRDNRPQIHVANAATNHRG